MKKVDLHTHSYYSDGLQSPKEVVSICKKENIYAMSLTDHDGIDGLEEAEKECKKQNIEFIPGVEITGIGSEILGYFFDRNNSSLLTLLDKQQKGKVKYIEKKIEGLKDLNIDIEMEEVIEEAQPGRVLMNPHIARLLVKKRYADNLQEAFEKYISKVKVRLDTPPPNPKHIIKTIVDAGGLPVLPHPWLLPPFMKEDLEYLLAKYKRYGLVGIETVGYCPDELLTFDGKNIFDTVKKLAEDHDLIPTGGSDFHGTKWYKKNIIGECTIDYSVIEKLKKLL